MRRAYPVLETGARVTPSMKGWKAACCDCGLVHSYDFEVVEQLTPASGGNWISEKPRNKRPLRVAMTIHRENRSTAQVRRQRKARGEL